MILPLTLIKIVLLSYLQGIYVSISFSLQVENEYGWYQINYGEPGNRYASWAMQTAFSLNIGVPWIMCQQYTALPDYVVRVLSGQTVF